MKYIKNYIFEDLISIEDMNNIKIFEDNKSTNDLHFFSDSSIYSPSLFSYNYLSGLYDKIINKKVLDLFCGSGFIGINLAQNNILVDCADISPLAINIATLNAEVNHLNNVRCIKSNVFENIHDRYDAITCIPPMLSSQEYDNLEDKSSLIPRNAYDAGEDATNYYKILIKQGKNFLNNNGIIYLPVSSSSQKELIINLLKNSDWNYSYKDRNIDYTIEKEDHYHYPFGYILLINN